MLWGKILRSPHPSARIARIDASEVHTAMQARGFRGEIRLLDELEMRAGDWLRLAAFVGTACIVVWLGR